MTPMTRAPRVAVVGSGHWGQNLVRVFGEIGALEAVCDADPALQEELRLANPQRRVLSSLAEALADERIAAVAIATPAELHAEMVREALLAGKDVFVEKPLSLAPESGRSLVDLAKRENRILMVGHILWYHPAVTKLKELVVSGELGRLQYVYSNRLNLGKIRREENILWSFAPHDVSVILGLLNEMPIAVQAQGGNYLHDQIADVTVSLLTFASGVRAHIFVSWLHPFKEQKLIVVGDRKMAVFNDVEKTDKLLLYSHSIEWKNHMPVPTKAAADVVPFGPGEPLRLECEHFLDCVATRKTPRTDGEEGLRVLSVLHECEKALGAGGLRAARARSGGAIHPSAFIDEAVEIGEGSTIWHVSHVLKGSRIGRGCRIGQNVVIGPNAIVGDGVKIQNNVSVYEGVTLEDGVFCGPSMVFTNVVNPRSEIPRMSEIKPTLVRQGATLGANSTILCGNTIGRYAFVGAGAVVTKDVPDFALVVGNPARVVGFMCRCGVKLQGNGDPFRCAACGKSYRKGAAGSGVQENE